MRTGIGIGVVSLLTIATLPWIFSDSTPNSHPPQPAEPSAANKPAPETISLDTTFTDPQREEVKTLEESPVESPLSIPQKCQKIVVAAQSVVDSFFTQEPDASELGKLILDTLTQFRPEIEAEIDRKISIGDDSIDDESFRIVVPIDQRTNPGLHLELSTTCIGGDLTIKLSLSGNPIQHPYLTSPIIQCTLDTNDTGDVTWVEASTDFVVEENTPAAIIAQRGSSFDDVIPVASKLMIRKNENRYNASIYEKRIGYSPYDTEVDGVQKSGLANSTRLSQEKEIYIKNSENFNKASLIGEELFSKLRKAKAAQDSRIRPGF